MGLDHIRRGPFAVFIFESARVAWKNWMALLGFNRSHGDTQSARARRMQAMLLDLEAEVQDETRDIQVRYRRAVDDAAFSLQALENDEGGDLSSKVDRLSRAIGQYARRVAGLQHQSAFLQDLRRRVDVFVKGRRG